MSLQLCCHGMCKNVQQSDVKILNYNKSTILLDLKFGWFILSLVSEKGFVSQLRYLGWCHGLWLPWWQDWCMGAGHVDENGRQGCPNTKVECDLCPTCYSDMCKIRVYVPCWWDRMRGLSFGGEPVIGQWIPAHEQKGCHGEDFVITA